MAEVLYNKYRPKQFGDLIGLSVTKKILLNCLKVQKIPHAWLFYGPRGTGKTSTARIFAAAINSKKLSKNLEPNLKEEIVSSIFQGNSMCISEIDGASNRSVSDVSDLQEEMRFSPPEGTKKVYVIDEVHMLSKAAFNALLKTIEDPPGHVMFILATTNPEKVPETIRSRCQNLTFNAHKSTDLTKLIEKVSKKEKINIEKGVSDLISYISEGSARDALGNLEKLATFSEKEIKIKDAFSLFGLSDIMGIESFISSLKEEDSTKSLIHAEKLFNNGVSIWPFMDQLIEYLHNILIYKKIKDYEGYYQIKPELSDNWNDREIFIIQDEIIELKKNLKWEKEGLTLWRIIAFDLYQKINTPNQKIEAKKEYKAVKPIPKEVQAREPEAKKEYKAVKPIPKEVQAREPEMIEKTIQNKDSDWSKFLDNLKQADLSLWILLNKRNFMKWEGSTAFISVMKDSLAWRRINQDNTKKIIETVSNACLKKKISLETVPLDIKIKKKEPEAKKNGLDLKKEIENLGIKGEWKE